MRSMFKIIGLLAVLVAFIGCAQREVSKVNPRDVSVSKEVVSVLLSRDIDILFVVDNSKSMDQEQISLAKNFPKFIAELEKIEGGLPSVNIGVISTDVGGGEVRCRGDGDGGKLQVESRPDPQTPNVPASCIGLSDTGESFFTDIRNANNTRTRNYDPNAESLADRFACIARLGVNGCNFEQPLEAIKRALDPALKTNPGFLNKNHYLAVIIVSDEDDCSMGNTQLIDQSLDGLFTTFWCFEDGVVCDPDTPRVVGKKKDCRPRPGIDSGDTNSSQFMNDVDTYVAFLKSLKADPRLVIVSTITAASGPEVSIGIERVGDQNRLRLAPECTSSVGTAFPDIRLRHFSQPVSRSQYDYKDLPS